MNPMLIMTFFLLSFIYPVEIIAQPPESSKVDVIAYHAFLEPNFAEQHIEGSVSIKFIAPPKAKTIIFDSGNLKVTKIEGKYTNGFIQIGKETHISLSSNNEVTHNIKLFYHGQPKRGLVFFDDAHKLYTVYFTSEWMICNDSPDDKATLELDVLIPHGLISVASGVLKDTTRFDNKVNYSWVQAYETPAYTYGFTIGEFKKYEEVYNGKRLAYYSEDYSPEALEKIFQYTGDMISFFEEKSGLPFPQDIYTQVLIGNHYQEMSGFAILKKTYGDFVLKDSTETNLISHELAHQWWGNMITCKSWSHFWLNEAFATFMSAAYNEHRFGQEKYQKDIDAYFNVYDKIRAKGNDKSLVFKDWSNPSRDDRNLVYFKGAYVLHLLRLELGEEAFWNGVKYFSQTYYGKSVTTKDFQQAMEKSSNRSLGYFFNKWVYLK